MSGHPFPFAPAGTGLKRPGPQPHNAGLHDWIAPGVKRSMPEVADNAALEERIRQLEFTIEKIREWAKLVAAELRRTRETNR